MEIDRSRMPVLAFAACCLLALAVAFVTREWTAALALALAGVALALAMRANFERLGPEGTLPPLRETGETSLDELRAAIAERDMELDTMRASIDGLAEVIEALVAEGSSGSAFAPDDGLRALTGQIEALEARLAAIESAPAELAGRIDALEASLARLAANAEAKARAVALRSLREEDGPVAVHPAETGGPSRRSRLGALRDLALGGAQTAEATVAGITREKAPSVEAIPLFGPRLEDAEASLVAVGRALRPVEDGLAVLRLARDLAEDAAEGAGALIFARLDPAALDSEDFTEAALWLFEQAGEAEFRIVPMIPQAALEDGQPELLEKLAERGIGFALEDIRDWSLDLPALAKLGLRHILVDGPAMLRAAKSQKGEPSRLKAVLARSDIGLIAGNLADMDEVADVAALHADLLTGPALAGPRILEPA